MRIFAFEFISENEVLSRKRRGAKCPRGDTQSCGELFFSSPASVKAAKGCYYKVYVNARNFLAKSLMFKSSPIKNLKFCHALEEFKLIIKRSTSKVKGPQKVPEIGSFDSEGSKVIS